MVCECQWGLTSILLGGIVVVAAGAFSFFPVVLQLFKYDWYIMLCWAWFLLGASVLSFGCIWEICGCQPQGRWAKSREEDAPVDDIASAPTPYIMIA
mmetsp:Transcript_126379/g.252545  ORF Transcript_126379/g.252545 Transcript_126379/m.252545 type:complete len:97 (-) Transcript_126379:17-307(-)